MDSMLSSSLDLERMLKLPPPPPWITVKSTSGGPSTYANGVTGEVSSEHPLRELWVAHFEALVKQKQQQVESSLLSDMELLGDNDNSRGKIADATELDDNDSFARDSDKEDRDDNIKNSHPPLHNESVSQQHRSHNTSRSYEDFLCLWRETRLLGGVNSYTATLRYFLSTGAVQIFFEGVEGSWTYSRLDGPYGPVDLDDLFLGAQLVVFGRHLSVTSAGADRCMGIDARAETLLKRRKWLQEKIETVGATPVIKRDPPASIRNIVRQSNHSGRSNLRKMVQDNLKLQDQLVDLGLAHFLKQKTNPTHK